MSTSNERDAGAHGLNGAECPAIPLAKEALHVSNTAADSVFDLHESFGRVTAAMARLEIQHGHFGGALAEVRKEVSRMARKLDSRASQHDLDALDDKLEITAVTNLKRELARVRKRDGRIVGWLVSIVTAVLIAWLCWRLGFSPK